MRSIALQPVLDLRAVAALKAELVAVRGTAVEIDASQVQRLGGLCLQVLIAARNAWAVDGFEFSVVGRSDAFDHALTLFGAGNWFPATSQ
jgi:chemotaxis protein CheX